MRLSIGDKLSILLFFLAVALAAPVEVIVLSIAIVLAGRAVVPSFRPLALESKRPFPTVILSLLVLAFVMTLVNGLLLREGEIIVLGGVPFYEGGLRFGIKTGSRLLLIATSLLVFFGSVSIHQLASSLHQAGLHPQIVMTVLLTVHFLETIPERITRIFSAQEARGAPVRSSIDRRVKSVLSILTPLILSGIVESIERGTALELRGYHAGTRLQFEETEESRPGGIGRLFIALSIIVFLLPWLLP